MIYTQHRFCPGEWDAQTPLGFWDTNGSPNLGQTTWPYNNQQQQQKRSWRLGTLSPGWPQSKKAKRKISSKSFLGNTYPKLNCLK